MAFDAWGGLDMFILQWTGMSGDVLQCPLMSELHMEYVSLDDDVYVHHVMMFR